MANLRLERRWAKQLAHGKMPHSSAQHRWWGIRRYGALIILVFAGGIGGYLYERYEPINRLNRAKKEVEVLLAEKQLSPPEVPIPKTYDPDKTPDSIDAQQIANRIGILTKLANALNKNDYPEATKLLATPDVQESTPYAMYALAMLYKKGENGVPQDYQKARFWFEKAAAAGDWCGCANAELGMAYRYGDLDVSVNYTTALFYFQKSATLGNAGAEFQLGLLYENGLGVDIDYYKARDLFESSMEQNHVMNLTDFSFVQYALGQMYDEGLGVDEDTAMARSYYEKAAAASDVDAENALGEMYEDGRGAEQDVQTAADWYSRAANQGSSDGAYNLARLYWKSKNYRQAQIWLQKAAKQEHPDAEYWLGYMYDQGLGVQKNPAMAITWMNKAAEDGNDDAKRWIENSHKKPANGNVKKS